MKLTHKGLISILFAVILLASLLFTAVALNYGWFGINMTSAEESERLEVHILSVGDANAVLVLCGGKSLMIDCGSPQSASHVGEYLDELGIEKIDVLIITHAHSDHYGGYEKALSDRKIGKVYISPSSNGSDYYKDVISEIRQKADEVMDAPIGEKILFTGSEINFLGPLGENEDTNDTSVVVKLTFGRTNFLFPADMTGIEADQLIEAGIDLSAQVYLCSHHGSAADRANSYVLLREIMPDIVLISTAGSNSEYGYPHEALLSRLSDMECAVYRTDLYGDIVIESDGKKITFK